MKLHFLAGALLTSALLSGCGLWGSTPENQPAELQDIDATLKVKTLWDHDVGSSDADDPTPLMPAVSEKEVFAATNEGSVVAYNRESGKQLWEKDLEARISGGVGYNGDLIAVATLDGQLFALDAATGEVRWKREVPTEVLAPPQGSPSLIVVQFIDGSLVAYSATDGSEVWSYDSSAPALTLRGTASPLVFNNATIANFSSGKIALLSNDTGSVIWEKRLSMPDGRSELDRMVDAMGRPAFADNVLYTATYQGTITAMESSNGRVLWSKPFSSAHGVAVDDTAVYGVSDEGDVVAFDRRSGAVLWQQNALKYRSLGTPVVWGDVLAVSDFEGYVHVLSRFDGRFVNRIHVDSDGIAGDMQSAGQSLYILSNSGRLEALGY
ncbi:outer membrane protein assembly factor BamB [Pokkaliibacter sp. CJK22405]|uniref:outer membrane protein assembly factor BamB n=1 Tax=Pokkaliibacter sp. CJK22405 TaxID=3384615 RepID=UPI0039847BD4